MSRLLVAAVLLSLVLPVFGAPVPKADLVLDAYIQDQIPAGDTFVANVSVRTFGPDTARNVVITTSAGRFQGVPGCGDDNGGRCVIEVMPANQDRSFAIRIDREPVAGVVPIEVRVTSDTVDPNPRNNEVSDQIEFVLAPRLRFNLYGEYADPGAPVTYKTTLINDSEIAAINPRFSVELPEGWSLVSSSDGLRCGTEGQKLTCTFDTLAPRAQATADLVLRAANKPDGVPYTSTPVTLTSDHGAYADQYSWTAYFVTTIYRHIGVTNTSDDGEGSLRHAVNFANTVCTQYPAPPCKIVFDIAGESAVKSIRLVTPLPAVAGAIRIEGATQTERHGDTNPLGPEIEINGSQLTAGDGFEANAGLDLADLAVNGFPGNAVSIRSTNSVRRIERCYIGTDASGRTAVPNGRGIVIDIPGQYYTASTVIRDSVISGNLRSAIFAASGFEISISGNRIGASAGDDPQPLGNGASGIYLGPRASAVGINKNVIAFNAEAGIATAPATGYVAIRGNSIHDNGGLGIDYGVDGVTENVDPKQYRETPPPFPVIAAARYDTGTGITHIEGTVPLFYGGSIAQVELFANSTAEDHGEGELFLSRVALDGTAFTLDYAGDLRGRFITGTFTRSNSYYPEAPYLLTSEFGASVKVDGASTSPIDPALSVPRGADLSVGLSSPYAVRAGMKSQMWALVNNLGPAPAGPAVVEITVDRGKLESDDSRCTRQSETSLRCVMQEMQQPFYFSYEAPLDGERVNVRARVIPTTHDPDPLNNETSISINVDSTPQLQITVDSEAPVEPGATAAYSVHVANHTAVEARDVVMRIPMPHAWTFLSSSGWNCTQDGRTIVCSTPRIEGLTAQSFSYVLRAPADEYGFPKSAEHVDVNASNGVGYGISAWAVYEVFHMVHVTNAADDGTGSLRDAIDRANNECRTGLHCKIDFAASVTSIKPARALPALFAEDVTIEGSGVELSGANVAAGNGLDILSGGNCTVRGLTITGFPDNGIFVRRQASTTNYAAKRTLIDNVITGNTRGLMVTTDNADISTNLDVVSNVISGNARAGVFITAGSAIRIAANRIGVAGDDSPLPNGASGIFTGSAQGVQVEANTIAYNAHAGVSSDKTASWLGLRGNSLFANGSLGFDYGLDLVTFNDATDRRAELPLFPVILSAVWDESAKVTRIEGRAAAVNGSINVVELFVNAEPDGTGYGEAQQSLGEVNLPLAAGEQPFTFTTTADLRGKFVTATLSRRYSVTQSWTSEISAAVRVP